MENQELEGQQEQVIKAHPERYLSTISATLLALCKLLEGAAAGAAAYGLCRLMPSLFEVAREQTMQFRFLLEELGGQLVGQISFSDPYSAYLTGTFSLPGVFWIIVMILLIAGSALIALEALGLLALRFAKRGAAFVGKIHQLQVMLTGLHLGLAAFLFTLLMLSSRTMAAATGAPSLPLLIALIVIAAVCLIFGLLAVCYHLDIAKAMKTVDLEIKTDQPGEPEETHLSGISLLYGILWALPPTLGLAGYLGLLQSVVGAEEMVSLPETAFVSVPVIIAALAVPAIKYFAVCRCNHNLKK